jgi:leucyl/phenylalanyl-tRNA--protein transferase
MSKLPWLSETELHFPPVTRALRDPDGLLAVGGDLRPERLVKAYESGIFPWFQEEPILWWSPSTRMVLHPEELHVSRSMQKLLRQRHYQVTLDTAFARVIEQCALTREVYPGTWITPAMQRAYCQLHAQSVAHSVEVWQEGELVGGLYGIAMGAAVLRRVHVQPAQQRVQDGSHLADQAVAGLALSTDRLSGAQRTSAQPGGPRNA